MKQPSKHKSFPGLITSTREGIDVAAQTVVFEGAAYEIEAQTIAIEPPEDGAIYRLAIVDGALRLEGVPDDEWFDHDDVITLAQLALKPGQHADEGQLHVSRREGTPPPPARTVQAGPAQRRGPSPEQAARRQRRRDMESIRAKLAEGRTLTPQEVSEALRVVLERLGSDS